VARIALLASLLVLPGSLEHEREKLHAPAVTAAIVRDGQLVWDVGLGTRRRGAHLPVSPDMPSILASSTKTVVATMVMQLVQEGRLSLDQKLSDFYPQLPNAGQITIRMLLNHTSGLQEYWDDSRTEDLVDNDPDHHWTRDEALAGIRKPQFAPGTRYRYTNSNYIVLGGIIEQVTGQGIEERFQQAIAGPAGMTDSTFSYLPRYSNRFAHPYYQDDDGVLRDNWVPGLGISSDFWGPVWTDGGLASTAPDLARFGDALLNGRLVNNDTLGQMLDFSGPDDYGLGIYVKRFDGHTWIGHDGDYGGYESENWHDPERNLTITLTTDVSENDDADDTFSDVLWSVLVRTYDR
jgi:D-alanyl-D-alanine carboxypeptidase